MTRKFASLTFNLSNSPIRRETLHGRTYIVAPMAMLTEGVHAGSGGALLYKEEDVKRSAPAWNMKPIVVYHPELNGQGVSACDRDILETQQVGMVMNTRWDGKLRAEAWIDEDRATKVDGRVIEALEANRQMEVSTGLFTDNVGEGGEWHGEAYNAIATNHQPDHLALLPDKIGACSIADGAGLLQLNETATSSGLTLTRLFAREMDALRRMVGNAMSHGNLNNKLSAALQNKLKMSDKEHVFIADVFDDFVVFERYKDTDKGPGKLFRLGYKQAKEDVELTGDVEEVYRVTEYRTKAGDFVGNGARVHNEDKRMTKEALVLALIANAATAWSEEDKTTLMGMDEVILNKMMPKGLMDEESVDGEETEPGKGKKKGLKANGEAPAAAESKSNEAATMEQYIASAPVEFRDVLRNGLTAHNTAKQGLITKITANSRNKFTPAYLATKGIEELQGLAALAGEAEVAPSGLSQMFIGQATPASAPVANAAVEAPLSMPVMTFDDK